MDWWRLTPRDWLDVARTLWTEVRHDSVPIVAAGVAFYGVLGLIPALVIAVSLYGIFTDPSEAEQQVTALLEVLPESTARVVAGQIEPIATFSSAGLSFGVLASLAVLVWVASNAIRAVVRAVVIAYDQEGERSRLETRGIALALTVAIIVAGVAAIFVVAVLPALLSGLDPTDSIVTLSNVRWLALAGGMFGGTALLYRFAPPRSPASWMDVLPGSLLATVLWLAVSFGFSVYVSSFASYNETYGFLGAAVVLLLWFFLTSFAVILGAELNEVLALG